MDAHIFLTIFLMAFSTYLTRIVGFLVLRNRSLAQRLNALWKPFQAVC